MKKADKRQREKGSAWPDAAGALLRGSAVAAGMSLLLLLGCAAAISAQWFGQQAMERCVVLSCIAASLVGAAVSVRNFREQAMLLGVGTGMIQFLLLLLLGLLLYDGSPNWPRVPSILCACLCGGIMAGILGRKTKKKRRR